jgi:hypothetical protein
MKPSQETSETTERGSISTTRTSVTKSTCAASIIIIACVFTTAYLVQPTQASVISSTSRNLVGGSIAVSGSNVYAVWWNNKTGDFEVMFRASTDSGHTFGPKINISNSPGIASTDAQIAAEGSNVYVIWWETGANHVGEPFLRISYDNGKTFGEKIMLSNATAATGTG